VDCRDSLRQNHAHCSLQTFTIGTILRVSLKLN